jgi:hypothetical protein
MVGTVRVLLAKTHDGVPVPKVVEVAPLEPTLEVPPDEWTTPKNRVGRLVRRILDDR